jgi:Na+/H+ antiporter NhaD/arsenite permease-like protein
MVNLISTLLITSAFIFVIGVIMFEKLNRAVAALIGAIITSASFLFLEEKTFPEAFQLIFNSLFGSEIDGFVNFHSLLLILAMSIIVQISNEGGVFQFLAFKMIQLTKGRPVPLLITFCALTVFMSTILNNILTAIILIPFTISVSRILNINATPFVLTEAILINLGGTVFLVSSIPNILITSYAGITFSEFFLNVGIISIVIFFFTILFFYFIYRNKLENPHSGIEILLDNKVWSFVPDRGLMLKSTFILVATIFGFVIIPSDVLTPDLIAISGALFLIILSKKDAEQIFKKVDFELLFYLMCIFVLAGGLEYVGVVEIIGNLLAKIGGSDSYSGFLTLMWASAFIGASVDNIPITRVMLPMVDNLAGTNATVADVKFLYYGLAFGANWGDNLLPMGDNILVMKLAEGNKSPITMKEFFLIGALTTIYQLTLVTIFYSFLMRPVIGWILSIIIVVIAGIYSGLKHKNVKN